MKLAEIGRPELSLAVSRESNGNIYNLVFGIYYKVQHTESDDEDWQSWYDSYKLHFDTEDLKDKFLAVNTTLQDILKYEGYIEGIKITPDRCKKDLKEIRDLKLFKFFFQADDPNAKLLAARIRELSDAKSPLHIAINTKGFTFPWALIYEKEDIDDDPDRNFFWGFRHIIQQSGGIGTYTQSSHGQKIKLDTPKSNFSFNYDQGLDSDQNIIVKNYGIKCIRNQLEFFEKKFSGTLYKLVERNNRTQVLGALKADLYDRIIYFYCHAVYGPSVQKSTEDSYFEFTHIRKLADITDPGPDIIKLKELVNTEETGSLMGGPLVFINACESAEMSTLFYNNFLPHFIRKGAYGVIGTLYKVPQIFSAEFAIRLFDSILPQQEIDYIIHKVRKEFVSGPENNLLGLYYVSCCSPGLILSTKVKRPS